MKKFFKEKMFSNEAILKTCDFEQVRLLKKLQENFSKFSFLDFQRFETEIKRNKKI